MKSILPAVIAAVLVMGMVQTRGQQLQKVTLNYPTRSGASWPLFIAKEGGNMSRVADSVGLERTHLYRKLKQLNIRFSRRTDDSATT